MTTASALIAARNNPQLTQALAPSYGAAIRVTTTPSTNSFDAAPYSMRPKAGPLWSRTITSWIIVSWRWVVGSSPGIRLHSAKRTMKRLTITIRREAPAEVHSAPSPAPSSVDSEREPEVRTSARRPRNSAGSARQENVASRAAPMPSNGEPVSSAASPVKNRDRAKRYAKSTKSPLKEMSGAWLPKGSSVPATNGVVAATTAAARYTPLAVLLKTESFRKHFTWT